MGKMYLVQYSSGEWGDYSSGILFVTPDKSTAISYKKKFNKILKRWKKYYSQFNDSSDWIKDEYMEHFRRWHTIMELNKCFYTEIQVR
jgi:hypothetical protein